MSSLYKNSRYPYNDTKKIDIQAYLVEPRTISVPLTDSINCRMSLALKFYC